MKTTETIRIRREAYELYKKMWREKLRNPEEKKGKSCSEKPNG